jgi:hypothetical protein
VSGKDFTTDTLRLPAAGRPDVLPRALRGFKVLDLAATGRSKLTIFPLKEITPCTNCK